MDFPDKRNDMYRMNINLPSAIEPVTERIHPGYFTNHAIQTKIDNIHQATGPVYNLLRKNYSSG